MGNLVIPPGHTAHIDAYGNVVFVRIDPEDKGNFWGRPDGQGGIITQGGHPDIYDEEYLDWYNNNLMFNQLGPEYQPDPGKRNDLGGRDNLNPAVRRRNQVLVKRDQAQLDQVITPTDITLPGEVGQLAQVYGDAPQDYAHKDLRRDSQLCAYSLVDSPDMVTYFNSEGTGAPSPDGISPLKDPVTVIGAGPSFFGSAVLVGELTIGHCGVSQKILFDIPAAQLVKVPFNGSLGRLRARLYPKYYFPVDSGATRTYNIGNVAGFNDGPLTNVKFNEGPPNQMAAQGWTNKNPARVRGWIAEGTNPSDELGRATRSFSGTVPIGAAFAVQVTCPVAWYSNAVMLRGGQMTAAGVPQTLQFLITDFQGVQSGPYPSNTIIPISNSIESIQVVASTAVTVTEAPFELIYFISI